jgi:hypothetical protein
VIAICVPKKAPRNLEVICVPNKTSWNLESYFSSEQSVIQLSKSCTLGRQFHETHHEILGAAKKEYNDVY